jgi:recombination protein RecA
VLQQIQGIYGKNTIMTLGSAAMNIATTSTGSLTLDIALGGGYPVGRIVEIYGPEASGKTTLALHAVAEIQKTGGYFDIRLIIIDLFLSLNYFYL